jgi:hypothetical protein
MASAALEERQAGKAERIDALLARAWATVHIAGVEEWVRQAADLA